jgi:hypothetical protein
MDDTVRSNESLRQLLQSAARILEPSQTFSGHEYADPEVFFDSYVDYFIESSAPECQRSAIVGRYVEEDTTRW